MRGENNMIKKATFITSAAAKVGWITDDVPELCFIGRSNVGKSTFINALTNQKKLAKTSSTPGKTRLLNFFSINDDLFRIVDAPGYGYARVSHDKKELFAAFMEEYLTTRTNLKGVCLLLDMRHTPTKDDVGMYEYLKYHAIPVLIIGTKLDKLKRNDIKKNEKIIKEKIKFDQNDAFLALSATSKENLAKAYNQLIVLLAKERVKVA
jgi:GTP-binding protein